MSRGGRGRGRSGAANAGKPELDSSVELKFAEIPLFPVWPPTLRYDSKETDLCPQKEITAEERELLECEKEFTLAMRNSMYHRTTPQQVSNVDKYSDKFKIPAPTNLSLSNIPTDLKFFPDELHCVVDSTKVAKKQKTTIKDIDWSKLTTLEREEQLLKQNAPGDDDTEEVAEEYDEALDEDENDYLIDYYDEEFEGDGGGSDNYD